jgi:hypothetical protein
MLRAPLLCAFPAHLPIYGIGGDFSAMVIVSAPPLAGRITTNGLGRPEFRWLKWILAIAAGPLFHEPVLAWGDARLRRELLFTQAI